MLKKTIFRFFILGLLCLSFDSCHVDDSPFPSTSTLMQSITNDAMGAVGGVQTAVSVAGPPLSPFQAACYAAIGCYTGLCASGAFNANRNQTQWLNNYSQKIGLIKVNDEARALYSKNNLSFAAIGQLHNNMLDKWAKSKSKVPFGNNLETKEFMINNFDETVSLLDMPPAICLVEPTLKANPDFANKLTEIGVNSVNYNLNNTQDVEDIFNNLAQQNQNLADGILIMKGIAVNAWNIYLTGNYNNLANYLHIEVNKVNENYYNLDMSNFAVSTAMINIFTHSYYYWYYYLPAS
jgi:hypothetical protein